MSGAPRRPARTARERWNHATARLRHAALTRTPIWLSRGRLRQARAVRHYEIVNVPITLPDLPGAMDGLRITHLSDFHAGDLVTREHVDEVVDAANALGGDLIAVTGDLIDLTHEPLDYVLAAMCRLRAPMGVYFVAGNHDYLEDAHGFVERMREAELTLLMNEQVHLTRDGASLTIAGIDYAARASELTRHVSQALRSRPLRIQRSPQSPIGVRPKATSVTTEAKPNDTTRRSTRSDRSDLRILLSHHPNAFDAAAQANIDLTLAGHTHGGQVVMTNQRGRKGSIGLANLAHRYPKGLFRQGDSYLYVTSGIGSWFPLRVKCPPEIATIQLIRDGS